MNNRAARRYGGIAVLSDFNLALNRRLHIIGIVASRCDILRTIEHPAVLLDKPEVLGQRVAQMPQRLAVL
jgi:hypothetical protein